MIHARMIGATAAARRKYRSTVIDCQAVHEELGPRQLLRLAFELPSVNHARNTETASSAPPATAITSPLSSSPKSTRGRLVPCAEAGDSPTVRCVATDERYTASRPTAGSFGYGHAPDRALVRVGPPLPLPVWQGYGVVEMNFRQLFPEPAQLPLAAFSDILASLRDRASARPYTLANFVSSVDGRATIGGRSAPLSVASDRALFHALREAVDAVMAGTGTLRVEHYGRMIKDPAARQRRIDSGLAPEPLAVVVSRSGQIPYEIPLFTEPEARIVEFTGATAPR